MPQYTYVAEKWSVQSLLYRSLNVITTANTVKPVLSGHSKIDKTKVLKTKDSLKKVESIALSDNQS